MSLLCQTTLLKALEEPSPQGAILLQCSRPDRLLPTVRSRLHFIESPTIRHELGQETALSVMERDDASEVLRASKDRQQVQAFLEQLLVELKARILNHPTEQLARQIKLTDSAAVRLAHNANWKLNVDRFLQDWFEKGKEKVQ